MIAARQIAFGRGAAPGPTPAYWGLCFTAEQANSTVRLVKNGNISPKTIMYSTDGETWSAYTFGIDIVLENVGDKVWMKAGEGGNPDGWFSSVMVYYRFRMTGLVAASGNLMSIVDGETETFTAKNFQALFQGCKSLTTAPELPATTLVKNCYNSMFQGCTSLTTAPDLPATTLATNCYLKMFYGCSSLISVPAALPAETLFAGTNSRSGCYGQMFQNCTSLTTAPALPATALVAYCYQQMFSGCTSLTTAPELPATTLADGCYFQMFRGCSSLATVRTQQTQAFSDEASESNPTLEWIEGVAETGTFYCPAVLGTNETISRGVNACPEGWTVVNI